MTEIIDVAIIGAGVVGLAVAARVCDGKRRVVILEKNDTFGRETSSRNSQVIHSGLYYPTDSLKAKLCVQGNGILYSFCRQHGIGHRRVGKLVVAADHSELQALHLLARQGRANDVPGIGLLAGPEIGQLERCVRGVAGLLAPSTGIVDAHALMRVLLVQAQRGGALLACRAEVAGAEPVKGGFRLLVREPSGDSVAQSRVVVNCAGLHSDRVASLFGIDVDAAGYRLKYVKGEYFRLRGAPSGCPRHLIYPVPGPGVGLGIHTTIGLDGSVMLGPNAIPVERISYDVDAGHREAFYDAASRYLPSLRLEDLEPEMAGIRPVLWPAKNGFADFIIRDETDRGLPGLINMAGIDSPGLTSAIPIGMYTADLVGIALARC